MQPGVDWAVALMLTAVGLADVLHTHFAEPVWTGALVTLFVFLPIGLRRRYPVAVFATVVVASFVLELALGDPANSKQYGLEVFLAWLIVSYSVGAHADDRRHRFAIAFALVAAVVWVTVSLALGASNENTVPSVFFAAVAWLGGRAMRRREQLVEAHADRAQQLEREREERVRALVAEERARIARELHDVVAHSVSVMVVQAQAGPRLTAREEAVTAFESIEASGREALVELRRLLGILRTEDKQLAIGPQPGLASLAGLVEQVRDAGLPVTLRIEGEQVTLPPGVDLSAYRIIQEALTNTLKHAGRANAEVVVRYSSSAVELEIVDTGSGPHDADINGSGHGLIGMRERTALYGGQLDAGPRPDGGYMVRARLPLGSGTR